MSPRVPKGSELEPKGCPKGAKGSTKGAQRDSKGAKREPKASKSPPKGAKREPKASKRVPKGSQSAKKLRPKVDDRTRSRKRCEKGRPCLRKGTLFRSFWDVKSLKNHCFLLYFLKTRCFQKRCEKWCPQGRDFGGVSDFLGSQNPTISRDCYRRVPADHLP